LRLDIRLGSKTRAGATCYEKRAMDREVIPSYKTLEWAQQASRALNLFSHSVNKSLLLSQSLTLCQYYWFLQQFWRSSFKELYTGSGFVRPNTRTP